MAKKQSFADKMNKGKGKGAGPIDPETGEPIQFVRFVKFEKSPKGSYKVLDNVVGVGKKNQKEVWG